MDEPDKMDFEEEIDFDTNPIIKMEIDIDDDDDFVKWALEENTEDEEDPLLMLKPIVYTTKLDDMNTINQSLKEYSANEIIKKLASENKPKLTEQSIKKSLQDLTSYTKLTSVVQQLNFKARLKTHNIKTRNSKLFNQCKPCVVVVEDVGPSHNEIEDLSDISNEPQQAPSIIFTDNMATEVHVKIEPVANPDVGTMVPRKEKEVIVYSDNQSSRIQFKTEVTNITNNKSNKLRTNTLENKLQQKSAISDEKTKPTHTQQQNAYKKSKTVETPRASTGSDTGPSSKKVKLREVSRTLNPDSDDEDTALIHFRKKPIAQPVIIEKYTLIVLLHDDIEAHVYRVNPTKLVTDYYITSEYDEYKIAAMYPKEEKVIEHYCCWLKREEIITKICLRKNYSFIIQKFLKQPHSCHPGDCQCCCHTNDASNSITETKKQTRHTVTKSLASADEWIRGLLNRKKSPNVGLIGKAMSYIPKTQVKEKPMPKESEKYLGSALLRIKYTGIEQNTIKNILELYEIGKDGNVLRSYQLNKRDNENIIQKTYRALGLQTLEATYCCWYMREKLMLDLRMAKVSPTARKLIQMPHMCEKNSCNCCCKPQKISLKDVEVLPPTFKHTTSYQRNAHLLTIRFNVKSKFPHKRNSNPQSSSKRRVPNSSTSVISNDEEDGGVFSDKDSTPIKSETAGKDNVQDICNKIFKKFKSLKLGVTNGGKLEVILNSPAKNLSIAELKVLSDILTVSTNQMTQLGISPKEICNKINSQTDKSNYDDHLEVPVISAPKNSLLLPQQEYQDSMKKITVSKSERLTIAPAKTIPLKTTTTTSKLFTNMCSSISNLMETKNKNYVDSFKSFFQSGLLAVSDSVPITNNSSKEEVTLPKISDSFTLKQSSTEACGVGKVGNSRVTSTVQSSGSMLTTSMKSTKNEIADSSPVLSKNDNSRKLTLTAKRQASHDFSQNDKKIRVKASNELMPTNKTQTTLNTVADVSQPTPPQNWPGPIMIKREPQTNIQTIVRPVKPTSIINHNSTLQTQACLFGNNAVSSPNIQIVNSTSTPGSLYRVVNDHINGNGLTKDQANGNNFIFTVTSVPVTGSNNNNTEKTMLAQILKTPQVQPPMSSGGNLLPPLVPIRPASVAPKLQSVQSRGNIPNSTNTVPLVPIKKEIND